MQRRSGFTLIELVIVAGLIAIIAIVSVLSLGGRKRRADLDTTAQQMVTLIRSAQTRAVSRQSSTAWGVRFDNSTTTRPFYALYASSTYATSTVVTFFTLPTSVEYAPSSLALGATRDVLFAVGTSETATSTSFEIRLKNDPSIDVRVSVEEVGRVFTEEP